MNRLPFSSQTLRCFGLLLAALALLAACGQKDASNAVSQVAAKVGSEEISVHQINLVLSRGNTRGASPAEMHAMGRSVLEKLIDQQLAVQQAMDDKLNRTPDVVLQMEAARRDILAAAYIKQISGGLPKLASDQGHSYFIAHPQLFSERRIFNVQEVVTATTPAVSAQLRSYAAAGKPIEEAAAWLKGQGIPYTGGSATRAAEQIPLELLPSVHALKDGQSTVLESAASVTLLKLVSSQPAPVTEAAALPRIAQFLTNQRVGEAVAAQLKQLRANSKITYMGDYAVAAAPSPPVPVAATADTTPVAGAVAGSAAEAARSSLEKGVAGLK